MVSLIRFQTNGGKFCFFAGFALTRRCIFDIISAAAEGRKRVRKNIYTDILSGEEKGENVSEAGKNQVSHDKGTIKKPVSERGQESF